MSGLAAATALALGIAGVPLLGDDEVQPVEYSHNAVDAPTPIAQAVFGQPAAVRPGQRICKTTTSNAANVNTDCDPVAPHNETSIAVNPLDANNIIGGVNDYQLGLTPGGTLTETLLSRAHVSFDGGKTWAEYPITFNSAYQATGDPAVAFDASGRAYYATLGFRFAGSVNVTSSDVLVANSTDGGKTWRSVRVAEGSGSELSVRHELDKEYIAAWGNGNAIVTWADRRILPSGFAIPLYSSVTHDGGATWSAPRLISGSIPYSTGSVPTVAADGRIYVAFLSYTGDSTGRDRYEVVEVSPSTGARLSGPFEVATVYDGNTDYPIAFERQTYQDSLFRTWSLGNVTADPTDATHLAVVWSDMRNSTLPAPEDPYSAVTNSDIIVSESFDRGHTWSSPAALTLAADQFMPWGAFDASGLLRIGFFDRQYDGDNHEYGYSLATGTVGSGFSTIQVSTALSQPTKDDRWFAATVDPSFPSATSFMGDYSNIAVSPNGSVLAYWTDMREAACFAGLCKHGQDAYFATVP